MPLKKGADAGNRWPLRTFTLAIVTLATFIHIVVIAPSLAYRGEATSGAGLGSFGVAYGLYNVA